MGQLGGYTDVEERTWDAEGDLLDQSHHGDLYAGSYAATV